MSFDALLFENDKELFKHIACFFVLGMDQDVTATILDACDINTRYGIINLIDKCLLSIGWNNKLKMHQLIKEMGRDLVRQESPKKPWKRSRLWCHEESFMVLKQKRDKGNILGLALDMRMLDKKKLCSSCEVKTESFRPMNSLMLLQLNHVQLNGCFENFPEELRWLCMHGFPLKSMPLDLPMENVVVLDMSHSYIKSFDMSYSSPEPPLKRQKGLIGSSSNDKRLLRSLKILDLGFCEQLHYVGGFSELPAIERLIVRSCISLTEVCESIEQCVELVHIDVSYCHKLKKVPISIEKLKKLKTLLLDAINSNESQLETIACDFKFFEISLPSSLTRLSLASNNLCNESFPTDMSCLAMLKELSLSDNPIVSMPNCVRTLPRLQRLSMDCCDKMISIEYPPCTLKDLSVYDSPKRDFTTMLRRVKFDPEMSPLKFSGRITSFGSPSEIDGIIKIQPLADVDENVLQSLGWINLEFIKEMRLNMYNKIYETFKSVQTQMYYQFGIFNTIYASEEMPDWITCRSKDGSISFTIPASPNKLKGLNFCCIVDMTEYKNYLQLPWIKINNVTTNQTWCYKHYNDGAGVNEKCGLSSLSHWMFGPNEMKGGDHITITLVYIEGVFNQVIKECGISLVYEDDNMQENEDGNEDVLGYYKSWNYVIGGDLSAFQLTTGEYILDCNRVGFSNLYPGFIEEHKMGFIAFSQKKNSKISIDEVMAFFCS